MSLATVYRTLDVLKELGLVQDLNFEHRETRYDSYVQPPINLVCRRCGNISDLDHHLAKEIISKVAGMAKFSPTGQRLDVYGVCEKRGLRS